MRWIQMVTIASVGLSVACSSNESDPKLLVVDAGSDAAKADSASSADGGALVDGATSTPDAGASTDDPDAASDAEPTETDAAASNG